MNVLEYFGLYIVKALGFMAHWLGDITYPFPWPLVMAVVALPLVGVAHFIVWLLRGMVWPVRCKHPVTTVRNSGDSACRSMTIGEWHYCWHHSRRRVNYKGQLVDPRLPRWQTVVGGRTFDRDDIKGSRSSVSLLFYRGFARRPWQVITGIPGIFIEQANNLGIATTRLLGREVNAAAMVGRVGPTTIEREKYRGINEKADRADQALLVLKWLLPAALIATAATVFIDSLWTIELQYFALLLLWIVVEVFRHGILKPYDAEHKWWVQALKGTLKGFLVVIVAAIIIFFLDQYGMDFLEKIFTK